MSSSESSSRRPADSSIGVVIAAAGSGRRAVAGATDAVPKQWLPLGGIPLVAHAFRFFDRWEDARQIVLALDAPSLSLAERLRYLQSLHGKTVRAVAGAGERQESVWAALQSLDPVPEIVMVHDAARPFPPREAIARGVSEARESGGAILAARLVETVKQANERMEVVETLDRNRLWRAQTPQIFRGKELIRAYRAVERRLAEFTDDAAIFEAAGGTVRIVESPESNFKVTHPEDFARAERMLSSMTAEPS
ncbi:2-C-methyl-D-erythritol 4-phosphate cytidylyltransferase [Candidatus Sumerlaeota bacterium]|nr:2-C-methyl-D-erythritol 4-phosphate cytidylyltransferase [Candidatus Sumerlaeota bacterium]